MIDSLLGSLLATGYAFTPLDSGLAEQLEFVSSLSIFLLASVLAILSGLAWRRERDRRMLIVTVAYSMFVLRGIAVVAEGPLDDILEAELIEYGSPFLVVLGLLLFFIAITQD